MIAQAIKFVLNSVPRPVLQRVVHFVTPVLGLFYLGRKVSCPICGGRYREFLPYGYVNSRKNSLCPRCLALERHRLLWVFLQQEAQFFNPAFKVLHVAPEHCFIKRFERVFGDNYITADLFSPLAKVKMDVQNIPFEANTFDVILCNHILEHVDDDRKAMRELLRVLKSGGWGVLLSPVNTKRTETYEDSSITSEKGRAEAFGQKDHLRDYGLDYPDRLREEGFEVESIDFAQQLGEAMVQKYALSGDIIYLVRKK